MPVEITDTGRGRAAPALAIGGARLCRPLPALRRRPAVPRLAEAGRDLPGLRRGSQPPARRRLPALHHHGLAGHVLVPLMLAVQMLTDFSVHDLSRHLPAGHRHRRLRADAAGQGRRDRPAMGAAHARLRRPRQSGRAARGLPARRLATDAGQCLTFGRPNLLCRPIPDSEDRTMAKATTIKIKLAQLGRHRLLLRHQEELAHQDRQAGDEEIRPGRAQARRVPRNQDQVGRASAASRRPQSRRPPRYARSTASTTEKSTALAVLFCVGGLRAGRKKWPVQNGFVRGGHSIRSGTGRPHGPRRCGGPEHSAGFS